MKPSIVFSVCFFFAVKAVASEERIAGGSETTINQFPFATALLTNGGITAANFTQACGGTILTTTAILSAASCFYNANATLDPASWWRARVGSSLASSGGTIHLITRLTPHQNFTLATLEHDLLVMRTTVPIEFQFGIVQAAFIAGAVFTLSTNQPVQAIGWGATSATVISSEQLRAVQFWVVDQTTCRNRYNELNFTITDNMICAGWLDVGLRGQCQGDTGSPLVESGVVAGVFSWSEGCAQARYPSINTRIAPYTRWIITSATASLT